MSIPTPLGRGGLQSTPLRTSLRQDLGVPDDPDFDMALPTGWVRRESSQAEQQVTLSAVRARLMQAHRPDMYARLRPMMEDAFAAMAEASVVGFFTPATGDDEALALPASMVASIRRSRTPGESLDPLITALIREAGATPLLGDKRFLRFERETRKNMDDVDYLVTNVVYLTPIPGAKKRRALQITATIARPVDVPPDDRPLVLMRALFDLCVSTLTWVRPAPPTGQSS